MSDILEELSAARRADAEEAARRVPWDELLKKCASMPPTRDFKAAFRRPGVNVIAELKKASPSEGLIRADFNPVALAHELASSGAAAISVLCEPHRFLGDERYLSAVCKGIDLPLLYKDFITTRYQVAAARAAGADAILLIAAVLDDSSLAHLREVAADFGMSALVETHTEDEIRRAVKSGAEVIGVNCRDLRTFKTDPAITARLIGDIPATCIRIAESGIRSHEDIAALAAAGADGFLIGTTIMRAPSPGAALSTLTGKDRRK